MNNNKNTLVIVLIIIVAILIVALAGAIVYIMVQKDKTENSNRTIVGMGANSSNDTENLNNTNNSDDNEQIDDTAVQAFNAKFTQYENVELKETQVLTLLDVVSTNNESDSEHVVKLNEEGITDADDLESSATYIVELSYDDDGYVNEITITDDSDISVDDEQDATNTMNKVIFNSQFMSYQGEITGEKLNELLRAVKSSNNNNKDHQIGVTSNNLQNLSGITNEKTYNVVLSYNEEGYVVSINIDEKL